MNLSQKNNFVKIILTESKKPSAAGILAVNKRNKKILIGKRSENVANPGVWVFPGGKVEKSESYRSAAKREFQEETWYVGGFEDFSKLYTQRGEFDYHLYIATVSNFVPKMDDREFSEMVWIDFEQFLSKVNPKHPELQKELRNPSNLKKIRNYLSVMM